MVASIFHTESTFSLTVLRVALGIVLFPHGAQKLLGWFGGYGFKGTLGFLTGTVGLPGFVGVSVILVEFFAPLLLIAGLATRGAALAVFGLFVGIILTSHLKHGFWMNWYGQHPAGQEGYEYHLLVLGMAAALILGGAGKWALDGSLAAWVGGR